MKCNVITRIMFNGYSKTTEVSFTKSRNIKMQPIRRQKVEEAQPSDNESVNMKFLTQVPSLQSLADWCYATIMYTVVYNCTQLYTVVYTTTRHKRLVDAMSIVSLSGLDWHCTSQGDIIALSSSQKLSSSLPPDSVIQNNLHLSHHLETRSLKLFPSIHSILHCRRTKASATYMINNVINAIALNINFELVLSSQFQ